MKTQPRVLAVLIGALFVSPVWAEQAPVKSTEVGTISIVGEGDRLGNGQMVQEDSPKARSSVTRAKIDKERSTASPYQLIDLLPGVNATDIDGTGTSGGTLSIRGFNSDQLGFTVNGAPVNDSGNFAVYSQEYVDQENLCEVFVTQGSTDTNAPHVGAAGGNVGIVSCGPLDKRRLRFSQTVGQREMSKTFVRFDTGRFFDDRAALFISGSKTGVDKWRGYGSARREHVDAGGELKVGQGSKLSFSVLYNDMLNNNYAYVTQAQYLKNGRYTDFSNVWTGNPKPVAGTAQVGKYDSAYYNLALNPFRNALLTTKGEFALSSTLKMNVEPYFWYGYGTGGTQEATLKESGFLDRTTGKTTAGKDLNGDGDKLDTLLVYRGSLTETRRPGATLSFAWQPLDNHHVLAGVWGERANHRQTAPATCIGADGQSCDPWLKNGLITRPDGTLYQNRDWQTYTKVVQPFVQDSVDLMSDRLNVQVGVRYADVKRDFTNFANEGSYQFKDYSVSKSWTETLPSFGARYQITPKLQTFVNVAKNFRVPGNYSYGSLLDKNGNLLAAPDLKAETSINTDLGMRYHGEMLSISGSVYNINFKDRLAKAYLPDVGLSMDYNVGKVKTQGLELEVGTAPVAGFSFYGSYSYTHAEIQDDMAVKAADGSATTIATAGKQMPNTPRNMLGASVQYAKGAFYATVKGKYSAGVYSTLANDEQVGGYTTWDLAAGYRFADMMAFKNPTLRLNVSNLFNKEFLFLNAGSGSAITTNATGLNAQSPNYYIGAPRFTSLSFSVDL